LLLFFQYVNSNKILDQKEEKIKGLSEKVAQYKDSTQQLINENVGLKYFSLEHNGEALEYFEDLNLNEDITRLIEDAIYTKNEGNTDNPLVPFEGMEGKFKINKVKILNHKWIITDFTDGTYWVELFIKYEFNDKKELILTPAEHFLYPKYEG